MATTNKVLNDKLRSEYIEKVSKFFQEQEEEVLVTGSGEISIPVLDSESNEKWIQIVVKVPTGSRDGDPFDGYSLAEDYQMKQKEKAIKAAEAAKKKEEKRKKDEASRKAKAEAREARKAQKEG